ncbi:MAG: hypothetical protein P4L57_02920 [Rhizomicrobium sp.]|nr:hypothetical protein [Rhizomicrobium sp.]
MAALVKQDAKHCPDQESGEVIAAAVFVELVTNFASATQLKACHTMDMEKHLAWAKLPSWAALHRFANQFGLDSAFANNDFGRSAVVPPGIDAR